jgi:hypothetical protein
VNFAGCFHFFFSTGATRPAFEEHYFGSSFSLPRGLLDCASNLKAISSCENLMISGVVAVPADFLL